MVKIINTFLTCMIDVDCSVCRHVLYGSLLLQYGMRKQIFIVVSEFSYTVGWRNNIICIASSFPGVGRSGNEANICVAVLLLCHQ